MPNTNATEEQLTAIRSHAVNDVTRAIMRDGVRLTHEQADALGQEAIDWMGGRLGLNHETDTDGISFTPFADEEKTSYFVVPAPGHYGDRATVLSSHADVDEAHAAAGRGYVVRKGSLRKGATWRRANEQHHAVVAA